MVKKKIGIKSITYYLGYLVFEREQFISVADIKFDRIPPGIYSIDEMIEIFRRNSMLLEIEEGTFFVKIKKLFITRRSLEFDVDIFIQNEIMTQLGFKTDTHVNLEQCLLETGCIEKKKPKNNLKKFPENFTYIWKN